MYFDTELNDALTGMVADSDAAADLPDPETLGSDDEKELEKEIAALEVRCFLFWFTLRAY